MTDRLEKALVTGDREARKLALSSTYGKIAALAKPFLKWAGGKGKLVETLRNLLPEAWPFRGGYVEPFVGGGAVFFAFGMSGHTVLGDSNAELVKVYRVVRDHFDALEAFFECVASHWENTREDFERVRSAKWDGNEPGEGDSIAEAGTFIWLNRHCFNGLYRVNKRGEFNVPFGRYTNVTIDTENLRCCSARLAGVELECADFEQTIGRAKAGDLVYMDPPYLPLSKTSNFASYTKEKFGLAEHERLARVYAGLSTRGVYAMLSMAATPFARDFYARMRFVEVKAPRAINSKPGGRGLVPELVILNYDEEGRFLT